VLLDFVEALEGSSGAGRRRRAVLVSQCDESLPAWGRPRAQERQLWLKIYSLGYVEPQQRSRAVHADGSYLVSASRSMAGSAPLVQTEVWKQLRADVFHALPHGRQQCGSSCLPDVRVGKPQLKPKYFRRGNIQ
jgi:hypothetical protein